MAVAVRAAAAFMNRGASVDGTARKDGQCSRPTCAVAHSELSVSLFQHRRKAGGFRFATFFGARLLEAPVQAHLLQSLLSVQFFLEAAKRLFYRFTFF